MGIEEEIQGKQEIKDPLDEISGPSPLDRISSDKDPLDRIATYKDPLDRISGGDPLDRISRNYPCRRY